MIYTVTFNPSIDYIVSMDAFKTGRTNRTREEQLLPGGKGINVSIVLKNLGIQSTALGFIAGFTGEEIEKRLTRMGIATGFLPLADGCSRINVKFKQMDGTEINGRGPEIPSQKERELTDRLAALKEGDVLFLSGSIPSSMPDDTYQKIMERLDGTGVRVVVDATKELLLKVLPHRPFLIKPNHHELGEIFGVTLRTREAALPYAKRLKEQGAENVLVSMGGGGAVLAAADGSIHAAPAPKGTLVSSVGAGDSMVAGFMAGFLERHDYEYAFHMGLAAGSASAFSEHLATREAVEAVYRQIVQRETK